MNKFPKYVKKHGDIRNQLNAIGRIHRYLGFKVLINSFIYANFDYCPLIWHFCSAKLNKFKQGHLEFSTMILIEITKLFLENQASAQWKQNVLEHWG